jgi:Kef-type K+ transport system membrane component KefB
MTNVSFGGLLVVAAIALAAPLLVSLFPKARIPADVVAIVAGIVVGPSVLDWVRVDTPIGVLALLGLAFLLFLAGAELDLDRLRGPLLRLAGTGFLVSVGIGVLAGFAFHAVGFVRSPFLLAVALSATSLGLVVPILKDAGQLERDLGQLVVAAASVADFGAILLLSFFFSESGGGIWVKLLLVGGLVLLVVAVALGLSRVNMSTGVSALLTRLQDTTAEIRVRIAIVLLVAFVAVAQRIGLEAILGAFLAGAILAATDRDVMSHPHFRAKLDAIGYGFLVPVFFVASGIRFDLHALTSSPSAFVRVPLFLLALLVVRGLPAALYVRRVGRRATLAAGLLQATSLPFLVTAVQIGLATGKVGPATGAALIFAGLLSVVLFPVGALTLLGRSQPAAPTVPAGEELDGVGDLGGRAAADQAGQMGHQPVR